MLPKSAQISYCSGLEGLTSSNLDVASLSGEAGLHGIGAEFPRGGTAFKAVPC